MTKYTRKESLEYAQASSMAQEVLHAVRTVIAFNGQDKEIMRYENSLESVYRIGMKKGILMGFCSLLTNVGTGVAFTVALWYGPYLVRTECAIYSVGALVVVSC